LESSKHSATDRGMILRDSITMVAIGWRSRKRASSDTEACSFVDTLYVMDEIVGLLRAWFCVHISKVIVWCHNELGDIYRESLALPRGGLGQ
jgi:hypothetical protein